jgi:heme/copper-type cytochrome/quinol oxidase subunit 2
LLFSFYFGLIFFFVFEKANKFIVKFYGVFSKVEDRFNINLGRRFSQFGLIYINKERLFVRVTDLLLVRRFGGDAILEVIWTIIPSLILILIVGPSFALLYSMDEVIDPLLTIKVIGYQWYWVYEYSDFLLEKGNFSVSSYIVSDLDLVPGDLRLLTVDNVPLIPSNVHVRFLVTAADVLHSWAIPSFGLKVDAVPGRLNQVSVFARYETVVYGQCSELCGVGHGFMPIVVRVVNVNDFVDWVNSREL